MLAHSVFFYFFSVIAIFSSLMVITSRSTVNSVFFLILDFISVGCLFIMVGAEFLGMIILIVYVGAVAVLFLFVVMMLNVAEQKQSWFIGKKSTHIPIGLIVSVLILLELLVVVGGWKFKDDLMSSSTLILSDISNTHQLGLVMYTDYILYFQLAGVILLLSMIGAILLTFRKRTGVKKQSYFNQISRNPSSSIELRDVKFKYPNTDDYIFDGLNLKIKGCGCVGIIGENGSGKSTLVDILLGFLKVNSGKIFFNNKETKNKQRKVNLLKKKISDSRQDLEILYLMKIQ